MHQISTNPMPALDEPLPVQDLDQLLTFDADQTLRRFAIRQMSTEFLATEFPPEVVADFMVKYGSPMREVYMRESSYRPLRDNYGYFPVSGISSIRIITLNHEPLGSHSRDEARSDDEDARPIPYEQELLDYFTKVDHPLLPSARTASIDKRWIPHEIIEKQQAARVAAELNALAKDEGKEYLFTPSLFGDMYFGSVAFMEVEKRKLGGAVDDQFKSFSCRIVSGIKPIHVARGDADIPPPTHNETVRDTIDFLSIDNPKAQVELGKFVDVNGYAAGTPYILMEPVS